MTLPMAPRLWLLALGVPCLYVLAAYGTAGQPRSGAEWPQFRGAQASGIAEGFPAPTRWDAGTGENIVWKTPIPGLGHSSPIIWNDLVCVTTADSGERDELRVGLYGDIEPVTNETSHRWEVRCLDKQNGAERWTRVAHEGVPVIPRHPKSTHANSTLATDGTYLVAMFGSEGLYAYELETGTEHWRVDLGVLRSGYFNAPTALWGFAASPIIHDDLVVIQADVLSGSFLTAFNVANGDEVWRVARDDVPTWSSPTVHVVNGRAQLAVNGYPPHRGLRSVDGRRGVAFGRRRRHSNPNADRQRRSHLHHKRARTGGTDLCDQRGRDGRYHSGRGGEIQR